MRITWSLFASGTPRYYRLHDEAILAIRGALEQMETVVSDLPPTAHCKQCIDRQGYMCLLGNELDDQLVVLWDAVIWGRKQVLDTQHVFFMFFEELFETLRKVAAPTFLEEWIAGTGDDDGDLGEVVFSPCSCGGPRDYNDWTRRKTLLSNSCYNYAAKDLWIMNGENTGGARGAFASGNVAIWSAKLLPAGLEEVTDWNHRPVDASPDGWHAALALKKESGLYNFHFLRLDDDAYWTHKWSTLPPQRCDLAGKPILRDGIHAADLCGYEVKAFYWAEPPTHTS
jgi:hypothetical protein